MSIVDKALATQLANLQKRTGKSLDDFAAIIKASGLRKHGQIRDMLKKDHGMGHGDANTVTHIVLNGPPDTKSAGATDEVLQSIYSGKKEASLPIHEKLMKEIAKFGDFEIAPKKAYVSLRRKKQFATVGPPTNTRMEVGLNMKDVDATERLEALAPGGMCQYRIRLTTVEEVDAELLAWIRIAYDAAG
jgi:predicted transport protein